MLAAVARNAAEPIVIAGTDRQIVFVNAAAEALFGAAADLHGSDVTELTAPDERERARALTRRMLAGARITDVLTMDLRHADGTTFPAEVTVSPLFDEDGVVIGVLGTARDVTAQRNAATLDAMVGGAREAFVGTDVDGRVTFFSRAAEQLFGWSAGEMIGRSAAVVIDLPDAVRSGVRADLERGEPVRVVVMGRRRDGTRVELDLSASPLFDGQGRSVGAAVSVLDVSERRRDQRLLERIIEHAPTSITVKDFEGHYLLFNRHGAESLGYRPNELIGRADAEVFSPAIGDEMRGYEREVLRGGRAVTFQTTLMNAAGKTRTFVMTKFPLPGADGRPEAIGTIASDVTDLRRAEADQAQLAALVQAAPDAIVACDSDKRIATWNPGAEAVFGFSAQEAIGRHYQELTVPEELRADCDALDAQARKGRSVTMRTERMRADGTRFPAQVSLAPLPELAGTWHGTMAMVRDISDLVAAERELQERAAQLERSNADLERFAYAASHDLQEPLRSIRLSASAVMAVARERLDADERELMAQIDASAERLSEQVRGLMEVARVALGAATSEHVPLALAVADAVEALRPAADLAGARIEVQETLPDAEVPRTEVSLVLQNLIANALKYHREDVPAKIAISAETDTDTIEVHVADNGVGLSEAELDRVFGFFVRGRTGVPGTGMGLAVARRMLERRGGALRAVSAGPGQGAVFTLRLPLDGER